MIDKKDADLLVKKELEYSMFIRILLVLIAICIVYIYYTINSIIKYSSDDSVPIVSCPKEYVVDAPVIMKTIKESSLKEKERWIRGFMRRFVLAQFPRTKDDVQKSFKYIKDHSLDEVYHKYNSLYADSEKISDQIESSYYKFYPKMNNTGYELRISSSSIEGEWFVEIDGYLIKRMSNNEERYFPTLKYKVVSGKATMENPEGLYVSEATMERITDYVSGKKENI
jgi:hypothetical protein